MFEVDGSADTTGTGVPVVVRIPANRQACRIWRVNILGPAGSKLGGLYVGAIAPTQWRDGSSSGAQDVAEYPNGLAWAAGLPLFFQWDKVGAASVHVEYMPES